MKFLALLVAFSFLFSCANKSTTTLSAEEQDNARMTKVMGTQDFTALPNADSTYVLYYSDISDKKGEIMMKIIVMEADKEIPLYEHTARNALVSWSGTEDIIVDEGLGVSTPTDNGRRLYKINVKTGEKEILKSLQNE